MEESPTYLNPDAARTRNRARLTGIAAFIAGLYTPSYVQAGENFTVGCRLTAVIGVALVVLPSIAEYQDYRAWHASRPEDDEGDDDGGDWPDDDPAPIDPKDPGGIVLDWIQEAEEYANQEQAVSV